MMDEYFTIFVTKVKICVTLTYLLTMMNGIFLHLLVSFISGH
jgi:hypothetical protein